MGLTSFCKSAVDGIDSLVEHKFIVKKYTEIVLVANKVAGSEVN